MSSRPDEKAWTRRAASDCWRLLSNLKARCKRGKLVDANGREIYLYRLAGCWGNPPADYRKFFKRQSEELQKLKKHYHVIEMTCQSFREQIY